MELFSTLSVTLTQQLSSAEKKSNGIFFTPIDIINDIIEKIKPMLHTFDRILEPSCGSCQFLSSLDPCLNSCSVIDAVEFNKHIYDSITTEINLSTKCNFYNNDFLLFTPDTTYDLIIGNPPYFTMKKDIVSKEYFEYFDGRPNIYILFIIKSMQLLKNNGVIAFVLPRNFLNCQYYEKLRTYIYNNFNILDITINKHSKYLDTQQDTITLIIQKGNDSSSGNDKYLFNNSFNTLENVEKLHSLTRNTTTLSSMGYNVTVGGLVWNEYKPFLTNDSTKPRIVYSSDIVEGVIIQNESKNETKKHYIDNSKVKLIDAPVIVVNRGYGAGKYKFNYAITNFQIPYCIENHLLVIHTSDMRVLNSFKNSKTTEFIELYFGNNAINTYEIKYKLPIFLD